MAKVFSMTMSIPGVEVWINYLTSNLKITTVEWTIPVSGVVVRVRLWNDGLLFYDRTIGGPASGTENVPGDYKVVLVEDPVLGDYYALPSNITYTVNIETIGG